MKILKDAQVTDEVWRKIQPGGKPRVEIKGGHMIITHVLEDGTTEAIKTLTSKLEKTVRLSVGDEIVEVPEAYILQYEGKPCRTRSKKLFGRW